MKRRKFLSDAERIEAIKQNVIRYRKTTKGKKAIKKCHTNYYKSHRIQMKIKRILGK